MKKNRLRRKLKGLFFVFKLHRIVPHWLFGFVSMMGAISKWISNQKNIEFNDFYTTRFNYAKRNDLYTYLIDKEGLNGPIDFLEFGVSKGLSFRWWAEHINYSGASFFGFDTFSGLPEDWGSFKKGDMDNKNEPPMMNDERCTFYQGLFQQTLPEFLKLYRSEKRKVIHMDADLYSSTLFVLTSLSPFLRKEDIILFDEFNVPMHEFKAFSEWVKSYYINYQVIGAVNNFYQVAIRIV
jgi:O-methyltransferase